MDTPDAGLLEFLNERQSMRNLVRIDDSSTAALVKELRNNSILVVDSLGAVKAAQHRYNYVNAQFQVLTATLIRAIENDLAGKGKAVASTARDKLIKTTLPLYPDYVKMQYLLAELDTEIEYLKSLYYLLVDRGKILREMVGTDMDILRQQHTVSAASDIMEDRIELFDKNIKRLDEYGAPTVNSASTLLAETAAWVNQALGRTNNGQ